MIRLKSGELSLLNYYRGHKALSRETIRYKEGAIHFSGAEGGISNKYFG